MKRTRIDRWLRAKGYGARAALAEATGFTKSAIGSMAEHPDREIFVVEDDDEIYLEEKRAAVRRLAPGTRWAGKYK